MDLSNQPTELVARARSIFDRLQAHINIKNDTPDDQSAFRSPASPEKLTELEQLLQHPLPLEFKIMYSLHDGSPEYCIYGDELLPIEEIIEQCKAWIENVRLEVNLNEEEPFPDEEHGISSYLFWSFWVPFTHNGCGDHICIDLKPNVDRGGIPGQIIHYFHDQDERCYYSTDLFSFFEAYLTKLDDGEEQMK